MGLNVDLKMDLKWAMDIERNRSLVLGNGSQPCLASASSRDGKPYFITLLTLLLDLLRGLPQMLLKAMNLDLELLVLVHMLP